MKQLITLMFFMGTIGCCHQLNAQKVRNFALPNGPTYEYTLHGTPAEGYTFLGSYRFSQAANFPSSLMVIDKDGAPVYYKDYPLADGTVADLRLYSNGFMSYFFFNENTQVGQYYIMDRTFSIVDSVVCGGGLKTDGHELLIMPSGSMFIICLEERIMDLSGVLTLDGFPGDTAGLVQAPVIQKLGVNKNIEFSWHALEHFDLSDIDSYFFLDPEFMDFGHANAIAIDHDGNILVSFRFFNEVTKISSQDSSIIWRLGGKNNDFTFTNDAQPFTAQHNCVVLPNGNLSLFDNGELASPPLARGVEYQLDTINMTATKVWDYVNIAGIMSYALGSMERQPNGNNLIAWGAGFTPGFRNDVVEVTMDGDLVTEFDWPQDYFTYRAYKKIPDWDMDTLRPVVTCDTTGGIAKLSAPTGHASYWWNTGDTTVSITVTAPGQYYVLVNDLDGRGYFGSKMKEVASISAPCAVGDTFISVGIIGDAKFSVYPNPASTIITIGNKNNTTSAELTLYNTLGMEVYRKGFDATDTQLDISDLADGSYLGTIYSFEGRVEQRFKLLIAH